MTSELTVVVGKAPHSFAVVARAEGDCVDVIEIAFRCVCHERLKRRVRLVDVNLVVCPRDRERHSAVTV